MADRPAPRRAADRLTPTHQPRRPQELRPARSAAARCWPHPATAQDHPHRGRRHADTDPGARTDDPLVALPRVLPGEAQHQIDDRRVQSDRRPGRCGKVHRRRTSSRCQRSNVAGVTRNADHRSRGNSLADTGAANEQVSRCGRPSRHPPDRSRSTHQPGLLGQARPPTPGPSRCNIPRAARCSTRATGATYCWVSYLNESRSLVR